MIKNSGKKIKLCRYGGIGKMIKQKSNYNASSVDLTFHQAPERKGFYAFLYPYIELFLLGSPVNSSSKLEGTRGRFVEKKAHVYKKFDAVGGTIWIHLKPKQHQIICTHGSWYKVHVSELDSIISKHLAKLTKDVVQMGLGSNRSSPYYMFSKDNMEVFVTKDTKINS